ncbi:calnexin isoform X2 [Culicoides brevitarsis]|uniref:calnexin isoform X2 n=1 Tax=Culicoides brevitarsis TaxID=469753 RepID=UPI00307CB15E
MKDKFLLNLLILGLLVAGNVCQEEPLTVDEDDDGVVVESEDAEDFIEYKSPVPEPGKFYFAEHFDDKAEFEKKWVKSRAKKEGIDEDIAKYDGLWAVEEPMKSILRDDLGLVLKSKAKHAAIASRLTKPFVFADKPLVVQYEVTWQDGQECGGSYIKLLSSGKDTADLAQFQDKTPYTIMFGPDKCGNDAKLHFIFRHINPINGTITEKHSKKPKDRLEEPFKDKQPHLYQLVLRPDNTFTVRVDHNIVNEGHLLEDFQPPVNPPKEIDDPTDKKPEDWDERERIPDPEARKPEDWDEDAPPQIPDPNAVKPDGWLDDLEEMIADPDAKKPDDWDVDIDGEWEAPLIPNPLCEKAVGCGLWKAPLVKNPDYKGKWRAPYIDNPNYKGKWSPRRIPNPDFFEDLHPFKMTTISAVGFELWSMSGDILFDNLVISDDETVVRDWAAQTYDLKRKQIDRQSHTLWERLLKRLNYKPGWWAVYFCYCAIPVVAYIYFLAQRVKEEKTEHHKKTDEPSHDDADHHQHAELDDPLAPSSDNEADAADEVDDDDDRERNSDPDNSEDAEEVQAPVERTPEPATRKRRARKD